MRFKKKCIKRIALIVQVNLISSLLHFMYLSMVCMAVICEVSDHWWETDNQWRKSKLPGFFFETPVIYDWGKINVHHLVSSSGNNFQHPCSISISNSQHTKSLLNGQTIPKVYNKNTRTRFALFVFTPRKWTWVDHALAVGKISLSVSFNSTEGNAVWQTAIQNMRQWTILKTNMYLQGMWVLCSFIANLKKNYFDFSYIRDWQLHTMPQRHQSWVQNETKSCPNQYGNQTRCTFYLVLEWKQGEGLQEQRASKQPQHPSRLLRAPTRVSWTSLLALCHVQSLSPSYCP